jgi:hypothetical protein
LRHGKTVHVRHVDVVIKISIRSSATSVSIACRPPGAVTTSHPRSSNINAATARTSASSSTRSTTRAIPTRLQLQPPQI